MATGTAESPGQTLVTGRYSRTLPAAGYPARDPRAIGLGVRPITMGAVTGTGHEHCQKNIPREGESPAGQS
jgi:hypothetical protein